jgi:hypothetical protein
MKLSFVWLMSMLSLLFLANIMMVLGYVNTQNNMDEQFVEHFLNPAPSLASGGYEAIGEYDNLENNQREESNSNNGQSLSQKQQLVALKEVDIDSLILEERERDIKKINQDIIIVNEMFK